MEGIKINTQEPKQNRRFKRPVQALKGNFSKIAKPVGFIAQTGAAAYLANKYVVQPSRGVGKNADAAVHNFYNGSKIVVEKIDKTIGKANAAIIRIGGGKRETESNLEAAITSMVKDINAEMQGQIPTTHSQEELQTQLTTIAGYRTQFQIYQTTVTNNQKQMADLKHELKSFYHKIAIVGEKMRPEGSWIDNLLNKSETAWGKLGANTEESFRINYEELEQIYENLNIIEGTAEQGLHQTRTDYTRSIKAPKCDKYAARQDYLARSDQILDKAIKVPELKAIVTGTDPMTYSSEQQQAYKENVCTIVQDSGNLKTQFQDMGLSFPAPPSILGTGLPIIAGVACFVAYSKLVKYEGKVAKGMKKTYQNVKNFMLTEDK